MIANEFINMNGEDLMGYVHSYIPSYRNIHFEKFEVIQDTTPHKVVLQPVTNFGCNFTAPEDINPGVLEICEDGIDNDCVGGDAVCPPTCTDDDLDGYYLESANCSGMPGFLGHNDCNDTNASLFYLQDLYLDEDHDFYGTGDVLDTLCWGQGGYFDIPPDEMAFNNLDCHDLDDTIWQEINLYADNDSDGYGWVNDTGNLTCVGNPPYVGYSLTNDDCKDISADCDSVFGLPYLYCVNNLDLINPGIAENCTNEIDDDCDGTVDSCPTHLECVGTSCIEVIGAGSDLCTNNLDCAPRAFCGDGICNGGETASTCPGDCIVDPIEASPQRNILRILIGIIFPLSLL